MLTQTGGRDKTEGETQRNNQYALPHNKQAVIIHVLYNVQWGGWRDGINEV
jgi:hypothetical protein